MPYIGIRERSGTERRLRAPSECAPIKRISFCIDTRKYFQRSSAMPPSAKKQRTEPGSAGSSSNDMEPPEETVSVRRILLSSPHSSFGTDTR